MVKKLGSKKEKQAVPHQDMKKGKTKIKLSLIPQKEKIYLER